jgi:diaminopimelate epimerase
VGAFLRDEGINDVPGFDLHTGSGVRRVERAGGDQFTVHMGSPSFPKSTIPMRGPAWETFLEQELDLGGGLRVKASALSMGNPHLVLFVDEEPAKYHVSHIGPALERDDRFPEGVNVEFARMRDGEPIQARVWERGSGETLACGSGACAVAVAANEAGVAPLKTTVRFPGGELEVERRDDGDVVLTGDASRVFDGVLDLAELGRTLDLRR